VGIDNIYIDIDSIEVPILDGSAEPFMQMLEHSVFANCAGSAAT